MLQVCFLKTIVIPPEMILLLEEVVLLGLFIIKIWIICIVPISYPGMVRTAVKKLNKEIKKAPEGAFFIINENYSSSSSNWKSGAPNIPSISSKIADGFLA